MNLITGTLARIIFALPFGVFGLLHLLHGPKMAGLVPSFLPGKVFWIYFLGVCLIAGCIGIMTKILGSAAALGLALLMAVFIFAVHVPGVMTARKNQDEMLQAIEMTNVLKNLALCGGALTWAGIFQKERK